MCLILDASIAGDFDKADFEPARDWLLNPKKSGRLVHGGKLTEELVVLPAFRRLLVALQRAGRTRLVTSDALEQEERVVHETALCVSNDQHVIALARVSGARTLCADDNDLFKDFKNSQLIKEPRGSIYKNPSHRHLLRHTAMCGAL